MSKKKKRPEPATLGFRSPGVDTHAHLDFDVFESDRKVILERAMAAGVSRIGNVFLGPDAYLRGRDLFREMPAVFFLLGIHPHDAVHCTETTLSSMRDCFAADPRLRALGEIGLDFYYDRSPRDVQIKAFQEQLLLAREIGCPVVLHSREADDQVIRILDDHGFADRKVLWHCFGGPPSLAERILARGWFVSIPGTATFKKNTSLQNAVAEIPLSSMVLETDCPFLAPEPYRGKRNEPAYTVFTAARIAAIKGVDPAMLWEECALNAAQFFSLENLE